MPHRLHLRLAIVQHLDMVGASSPDCARDPRAFHIGHGVRAEDYEQALAELLGLEIVAANASGLIYITRAGHMILCGPDEA